MDKQFVQHMDYKVGVATIGLGDKIVGPVVAGVDLVATRVALVDIKVGFSTAIVVVATARVVLATAMVVGKALVVHKVLVEKKVIVVHKVVFVGKFFVKFIEFQVGTDKFQLEFD